MSTTRTGKIARLPKFIRDQLGQRLENGEPGQELVKWLNGHSDVQLILKEMFQGRPVNEQNLSEWKRGGYQDWLRQEETRLLASRLTEKSDDLEMEADGQEISDRFARMLSVKFTALGMALLEKETDPEKCWERLCQVHHELSRLRRDDHRAVSTLIRRQKWKRQVEAEDEESDRHCEKEHRERLVAPFWAKLQLNSMADLFGGGENGRTIAAFILEMQNNLPIGKLSEIGQPKRAPAGSSQPGQT